MEPAILPLRLWRDAVVLAVIFAAFGAAVLVAALAPIFPHPLSLAQRAVPLALAALIFAAAYAHWRDRRGQLRVDEDTITVVHSSVPIPVVVPMRLITAVHVATGVPLDQPTTIPRSDRAANVVLELSEPVLRGPAQSRYRDPWTDLIAVEVEDPAQAALVLPGPRVAATATATAAPEPFGAPEGARPRPRDGVRAGNGRVDGRRVAAGVIGVVLVVGLKALTGLAFGDKPADPAAEYVRTQGRSALPLVGGVPGAVRFYGAAADGSRVYAWRTGDRLRVRVDTAPHDCPGAAWEREYWASDQVDRVAIGADGRFAQRLRRTQETRSVGGIDIVTLAVTGRVDAAGDRVTVAYRRSDDYRGGAGDAVCTARGSVVAHRVP